MWDWTSNETRNITLRILYLQKLYVLKISIYPIDRLGQLSSAYEEEMDRLSDWYRVLLYYSDVPGVVCLLITLPCFSICPAKPANFVHSEKARY